MFFPSALALFWGQECVVSGTISLYGHFAEKGQMIEAYIDDAKVAEAEVKDEGRFEITIPEYDPKNPETPGYKTPDDILQVKLAGKSALPTFSPSKPSLSVKLNVEQSLDVKLSTWGKIKALFK
jgi:hypothetical protein